MFKRVLYSLFLSTNIKDNNFSTENSSLFKYNNINKRGYPNIKSIIPLLNLEFLRNIDIRQIIQDQQKYIYNTEYNFIVNSLE